MSDEDIASMRSALETIADCMRKIQEQTEYTYFTDDDTGVAQWAQNARAMSTSCQQRR